jgi:outer membrane murein-binding lipoprotein Lpp
LKHKSFSIKHIAPVLAMMILAGCTSTKKSEAPAQNPHDVKADIVRLMPASAPDKKGWATDITAAFTTQNIPATTENICSVLAVAQQESNFNTDAPVPGLGKIAWKEIDRRADAVHVPHFLVHTTLLLKSPNGKSYSERLDNVKTEKQLSAIFDDFIDMVPMGQTLFGNLNPVHTGGPMQVSIAFAEQNAKGYPYKIDGSIRHEVFSRRGGVWFGVKHLLGYPTNYSQSLYRFADFNAGWYASRNAAFQSAVSKVSGIPLALDGDLINYGTDKPGSTELAVRTLSKRLDISNGAIRKALEKGEQLEFEDTTLYKQVYALADKTTGKRQPREMLPGITLESPKITRKLTTAWFAKRVDGRRADCVKRANAS